MSNDVIDNLDAVVNTLFTAASVIGLMRIFSDETLSHNDLVTQVKELVNQIEIGSVCYNISSEFIHAISGLVEDLSDAGIFESLDSFQGAQLSADDAWDQ